MIGLMARSEFGSWLAREMEARRVRKAQVARYSGVDASAVGRWLKEDSPSQPSKESLRGLAAWWKLDENDLLRLAGHGVPESTECDLPKWLRDLLPTLKGLDAIEGRTVEATALSLLETRELRADWRGRRGRKCDQRFSWNHDRPQESVSPLRFRCATVF